MDIQTSALRGMNVGWITAGEWMRYSAIASSSGTYSFAVRVASPNSTGRFHAVIGSTSTRPSAFRIPAIGRTGPPWRSTPTCRQGRRPSGSSSTRAVSTSPMSRHRCFLRHRRLHHRLLLPRPTAAAASATAAARTDLRSGRPSEADAPRPWRSGLSIRRSRLRIRHLPRHGCINAPSCLEPFVPHAVSQPCARLERRVESVLCREHRRYGHPVFVVSGHRYGVANSGCRRRWRPDAPVQRRTRVQRARAQPYIWGDLRRRHAHDCRIRFNTRAYSTLLNLDTVAPSLSGTYVGGLAVGAMQTERMMVFFGGPSQDRHFYALWFATDGSGTKRLLNTLASTLNGVPTNVPLNFRLHSASIDRSGRFVFLYPTAVDLGAPRNASQVYVWDTDLDMFTALTSGGADGLPAAHAGGHDAPGYGYSVNHDCCVSTTWDAGQWELRRLDAPLVAWNLVSPVMTPQEIYLSDHPTWNNARPDALVPFIDATFRYGNNPASWRAWDEEIIGVGTDVPLGTTVFRYAHHRSAVASDTDASVPYSRTEPRPNVSRDGRWVVSHKIWEKHLVWIRAPTPPGRTCSCLLSRSPATASTVARGTFPAFPSAGCHS